MDNISEIIKKERQIRLTQSQFSKIISEYYKKQYNLNGVFEFLPISYEYIDNRFVYDYSLGRDTVISLKKRVNSFFPCLIDADAYEHYKGYSVVIPGAIRTEKLNEELKNILPLDIIIISNDDIEHIFSDLGLSSPLYDCFCNTERNKLEYSASVKRLALK